MRVDIIDCCDDDSYDGWSIWAPGILEFMGGKGDQYRLFCCQYQSDEMIEWCKIHNEDKVLECLLSYISIFTDEAYALFKMSWKQGLD